ncbi:MAG: aspartate aminotransferase family protein, partial [Chloroflexi bacterium]|nr:aspartate aminotransferase family protein [Chloroflexota bacterium]
MAAKLCLCCGKPVDRLKRRCPGEGETVDEREIAGLLKTDIAHQIHPQFHVRDHQEPVVFVRGEGALLWDVHGREYIDGLSSLWNVAVGHGRKELAQVAARQMEELAF